MPFPIRRCTLQEAPLLAALARRTFFDTFQGTCSDADMQAFLDETYTPARLSEALHRESEQIFFALHAQSPAGYIHFREARLPFPSEATGKALELYRLYVDLPFHGLGAAQALMDFFFRFAQENGYSVLWLGVWEFNFRAQAFYRKYGFAPSGYSHPYPIGQTPQTDQWWLCTL